MINFIEYTFNNDSNKVTELKIDNYTGDNPEEEKQELMREQKRSILQSCMDRNLYNREGDDPCTSGVSMSTSEAKSDSKQDMEWRSASSSLTKQASGEDMETHKELVWYATYDTEMQDESFEQIISLCKNRTPPQNKISIKLENFDIVFAEVCDLQPMVYLQHRNGASCFIKLYLIHKDQLVDIVIKKNRCFFPAYQEYDIVDTNLINDSQSFVINEILPYGYVLKIGNYETYSIYTLTNTYVQHFENIKNVCVSAEAYIKELFKGMANSFPNFS